ncbi:hypothetical protein OB236_18925 [Paenibacillus sp. WQ 127069]|uniref:Uncharacterized protein n=1 Tax=Paenibacillus baimaensis TaxID=2982185 RepID=A0ABT2UHU9_9BACL|nr:hypothetical protein [Paenibacillus sp. WQ 127069]
MTIWTRYVNVTGRKVKGDNTYGLGEEIEELVLVGNYVSVLML